MIKRYTCIVCPNGCSLECAIEGDVITVNGNLCPRGAEWAKGEITAPKRNIATSVRVLGGTMELASVRLSAPIDKALIFPVMEEARKIAVTAPVSIGDAVLRNVLGTGADLIITRSVPKA